MVQFGEYPTEDEISQGGGATLSGTWRFSTTTVIADPGSGRFRYDTASYGTVTQIAIDEETRDGFDASNIFNALSSGDRLYIQEVGDASHWAVWDVSSQVDNTGWHTINVTVAASGDFLSNNTDCIIAVQFGGAAGGGGHPFSYTTKALEQTATAVEAVVTSFTAVGIPGGGDSAKQFEVKVLFSSDSPSGSLNLITRVRMGPLGTISDPIVAGGEFHHLTEIVGVGQEVFNHWVVVTPDSGDLVTITVETSAGTVDLFGENSAEAPEEGSHLLITQKTVSGVAAGLPPFSDFEEAADRAVNNVESDFVTLTGLDFPGVKDGVARYKVEIDMSYSAWSANNFITLRLYQGTTGDSGDTEVGNRSLATTTVTGTAHTHTFLLTPGASDLFGFSHQAGGATTGTIFGAGGADLRSTFVFVTRVT